MRRTVRVWRQHIRIAVGMAVAYRATFLLGAATGLVQIFLLKKVWTAVYAGRPSANGLTLDDLVVYLTLSTLQAGMMTASISRTIHFRVRTGLVFFDLARPVGYLQQLAALQTGATLGVLVFLLPSVPFAFAIGAVSAPAGTAAAVGYATSLLLAWLVNTALGLLIGLAAFWTLEIEGLTMLYRLVSQFFTGTMVPLTFFPGPLRLVADLLPFKYLGFVPASIYIGQLHGGGLARALLLQATWAAVLFGLSWLVWRRAWRRVVVQGG
jgi:ABC-2 type transport system permease protein